MSDQAAVTPRIAAAMKATRPERDGHALRQWCDDVVAVAGALASFDTSFNFGAFFTACGGL